MSIIMGYLCFTGDRDHITGEGFFGLEGLVGCSLNFVYPNVCMLNVDILSLNPVDKVTVANELVPVDDVVDT